MSISSPKKLVILTPFFTPNVGGAETFTNDLVELFRKNGQMVDVLTYQPLTTEVRAPLIEMHTNLTVYRLPWLSGKYFYKFENNPLLQLIYLGTGLFVMLLVYCIWTFGKPKRVIALGLSALSVGALAKHLFIKIKLDCILLTIYRFKSRPVLSSMVSLLSKKVNSYYCLSSEAIIDMGHISNARDIKRFKLWIDQVSKFFPRKNEKCKASIGLAGLPANTKVALFVARFTPEKNIHNLIDIIQNDRGGWHYVVIGDGPLALEFEYKTKHKECIITRIKWVDNECLPIYYSSADILLFGPADKDYLGRTAIECLSCGTPVLIYNESTYFGSVEQLAITNDIESGVMVVEAPLDNCKKIMCLISENALNFSSEKIRHNAKCNYSDANGNCFL